MNKIFRVVFNKSTQTFQAVSEFARRTQGGAANLSETIIQSATKIFRLSLIATTLFATSFAFADYQAGLTDKPEAISGANHGKNVHIGGSGAANEPSKITITNPKYATHTVLIGHGIKAAFTDQSGVDPKFNDGTTSAHFWAGATAIGGSASIKTDGSSGKKYYTPTAIGGATKAHGDGTVAIGESAFAEHFAATAIGVESEAKREALAIGNQAKAMQQYTIAQGSEAKAITTGSVAIGGKAVAGAEDKTGSSNYANIIDPRTNRPFTSEAELLAYYETVKNNPDNSVTRALIGKINNIAIGSGAEAIGGRNISIGENAGKNVRDQWNIENVNIGTQAGEASTKDYSVAVGYQAGALLTDAAKNAQKTVTETGKRHPSVYIGKNAGTNTASYGNIALGKEALMDVTDTRVQNNIAIGNNAGKGMKTNDGKNSAFGDYFIGSNVLLGNSAGAGLSGDGNIALGSIAGRDVVGDNNIFAGHLSGDKSNSVNTIVIGAQASTGATNRGNTLVGNYVNGDAKKQVGTAEIRGASAFGDRAHATGSVGATAIGSGAQATGSRSTAIGGANGFEIFGRDPQFDNTVASGEKSIAIGAGAEATAEDSISIGTGNKVSGKGSGAIGDPSIVAGTNSYSLGNNNAISSNTDNAISIGGQNNIGGVAASRDANGVIDTSAGIVDMASANRAMVMGFKNQVFNADDSMVIGNNNEVTAANVMVLGNNITTDDENAVILGNDSSGDETATAETNATVNGITYGGFVGGPATNGHYVSVGAAGNERQIKNVAAGLISATSTDAINGSQLYITQNVLGNVANSVVQNFGGNAQLDPSTGNITFTNIGNTGKTTIHEAIAASREEVKAGKNVTVDTGAGSNGQNIYTVNAWDTTVTAATNGGVTVTPTIDDTNMTRGYALSVAVDNSTIKIENGKLTANIPTVETLKNYFHTNSSDTTTTASGTNNEDAVNGVGNATGARALAAGYNATASGKNATAVGTQATANAEEVTAVGYNAGANATTGSHATFIGTNAGANSNATSQSGITETRSDNTYVGNNTGQKATGVRNTAVGGLNTGGGLTGDGNSAYGYAALYNAKGNYNAGLGAYTGQSSTGNYNTSVGFYSGRYVTGDSNVAIGDGANNGTKANPITASNTIAIGTDSKATVDNAIALGKDAEANLKGSVALGSDSTTTAGTDVTEAEVNGITYSGFAGSLGSNTNNVVSVGAADSERQIQNVAAGAITATSTDAINGSQLYMTNKALGNVAKTTAQHLGGGSTVNEDGTLTAPTYKTTYVNGDTYGTANNVGDALSNLNNYVNMGFAVTDNSGTVRGVVTPGDKVQFINGNGTTSTVQNEANGITKVQYDVNVDNNTIKIGTDGKLYADVKVAADTNTVTTAEAGKNMTVTPTTDANGNIKYTIATKDDVEFTSVKTGDTTINNNGVTVGDKVSVTKDGFKAGDVSVTVNGINAGGKKITNVAEGEISATSKDAVNGSQLYAVKNEINTNINKAKTEVEAGENVTIDSTTGANGQTVYKVNAKDRSASVSAGSNAVSVKKGTTTKVDGADVTDYAVDLSDKTKDDIKKGVDAHDTVTNKGLTFAGDSGNTNVQKLGSTVNVKGDENITTTASGNTVKVKMSKNIKVDTVTATKEVKAGTGEHQVTLNDKGVNVGGNTYISNNGINANNRVINNVKAGVNDTDAVNVSQLKQVSNRINHVNNRINKVDRDGRGGVAQAGAMANIPQVTKLGGTGIGVGVANYRGESALSVGASRLSDNGKHIIKGSVAVDTRGYGMAGAGYMYQW